MQIEAKLEALGLTLPEVFTPQREQSYLSCGYVFVVIERIFPGTLLRTPMARLPSRWERWVPRCHLKKHIRLRAWLLWQC